MSQYTTGEMAKLCNVTVRTVQYYDTRGILTPSALSEGGRRLYDDSDLKMLKVICFLRSRKRTSESSAGSSTENSRRSRSSKKRLPQTRTSPWNPSAIWRSP